MVHGLFRGIGDLNRRTAGCERAAACELALTGPFLVLAGVQTLPIAF